MMNSNLIKESGAERLNSSYVKSNNNESME